MVGSDFAFTLLALALWSGSCSVVAYEMFALDKRCALLGRWRVSESQLLFWAMIGGWPGAKLAQRRLRHKTRKEPFRSRLNKVAAVPLLLTVFAVFLTLSGTLAEFRPPDIGDVLTSLVGGKEETAKRALPRRFGPGS